MLRQEKGWTEYRLSEESGVPQSTITAWYGRDEVYPSLPSLEKICEALDITLSQLFMDSDSSEHILTETESVITDLVRRKLTEGQKEALIIFLSSL